MYMGDARGRWDGTTLVVETTNLKAANRGSSPGLRLTERFTRTDRDAMQYQVTFTDPATWTAPWTAALDMKSRPDNAGVFEYACHEGNHGMSYMLSAARALEQTARLTTAASVAAGRHWGGRQDDARAALPHLAVLRASEALAPAIGHRRARNLTRHVKFRVFNGSNGSGRSSQSPRSASETVRPPT
jgi:hypothetical protein